MSTVGGLGFVNGNSIQTRKDIPIINGVADFDLQTFKKGESKVYVIVYDLYDKDSFGTLSIPFPIVVK